MHSSENVHTFLIEGIFLKDPPPLIPLEIIEKLHTLLELFGLTESPSLISRKFQSLLCRGGRRWWGSRHGYFLELHNREQ